VSLSAWFATAVVACVFFLLTFSRQPPYRILSGGLAVLIVTGIVEPGRARGGFGNTGRGPVAARAGASPVGGAPGDSGARWLPCVST